MRLYCSRRISQATPPGGCLKAQLACLLHITRLLLDKMLVLKKTFSSYTSSRMPEGTGSGNIYILLFTGLIMRLNSTTNCMVLCSRRLSQAAPSGGTRNVSVGALRGQNAILWEQKSKKHCRTWMTDFGHFFFWRGGGGMSHAAPPPMPPLTTPPGEYLKAQ